MQDSISTMAPGDDPKSYLDKVFDEPSFIWNNGICDIDAVLDSVGHLAERLADIVPAAEIPSPTFQAETPTSVLSSVLRSDVTPSRSALIPLRSDVWNGHEPINYVSLHDLSYID